MKIEDRKITPTTKLANLLRAKLPEKPDPELKLELGQWYLDTKGQLVKVVAQKRSCGVLLPKYIGIAQNFFWHKLFMCGFEKQGDIWIDKNFKQSILCKAPKTRGRELISKAMMSCADWNRIIRLWYKIDSSHLWAPCYYKGCRSLTLPFKGISHDE